MCTRWLGETPRKYYEVRKPRCRKTHSVLWCCAEKRTLTSPYVCVYVGLSGGWREEVCQAAPSLLCGLSEVRWGAAVGTREKAPQPNRKEDRAHLENHVCEHIICAFVSNYEYYRIYAKTHFKIFLSWTMNIHLLWRYSGVLKKKKPKYKE